MVKYIVGMKRPPTMSVEELEKRWLGELAPDARKTPGLRKYIVNFPADEWVDSLDGFAELWFDDLTAARNGLATPEFTEARYFIGRYNIAIPLRMVVQEYPHPQGNDTIEAGLIRYCTYIKRPVNKPKPDVLRIMLGEIAPMMQKVPGLTNYVFDFDVSAWLDTSDGMEELWFDSLEDARKALDSPEYVESRRALGNMAFMTVARNMVKANHVEV